MVINQNEDVESLSIEKDKQKSDVFGLWVKLKIPKEEGMDAGDQKTGSEKRGQMNKYSNDMRRVCHICHKSFSSGKALGGHMRIHVQLANKKDLAFKKKLEVRQTNMFKKQYPREEKVSDFVKGMHEYKKTITATITSNIYGGSGTIFKKPTCIICAKDFSSMKSLFGHMRCHPERDWRGTHPPSSIAKNKSSSSSLSDADHTPRVSDDQMGVLVSGEENRVVDLTESLVSWPVTGKRGRKTVTTGSLSELSSSEDDQLHNAVNYLMMLAQGDLLEQDFGESEAANSYCKAKILEVDRISMSRRRVIDQSSVGIRIHSPVELPHGNEQRSSNEVGKTVTDGSDDINIVHGESAYNLKDDDEHDYFSDDDQMYRKKTEKLHKGDIRSSNIKVLVKTKIKKRKKMKLCDLRLSKNASPRDSRAVESTSVTLPHDKYRCNTCDKSFPTHQAPGGHSSNHNKFNVTPHISWGETKDDSRRAIMSFNNNFSTSKTDLDGRKRSNGSGLVETASSSQPSSWSETSHMCQKILDFDLNEAPPSEAEAVFASELSCSW